MNKNVLLLISIVGIVLVLGGCQWLPVNVAICGNEICESGESSICPSDCAESEEEELDGSITEAMCTADGGDSCASTEMCTGYWLDAGYTCCSTTCEDAVDAIYFTEGWNYVSLPEVELDDPIEDIFSDNFLSAVDSIYTYTEESWQVWHSDTSIPSDLENIQGGRAYIFVMNSDYTLELSEIEETLDTLMEAESSARSPTSIDIQEGWNLVGVASSNEEPLVDYFWSIDGSYASLWVFSTTEGDLEKVDLTHNYNLIPTHAYWVYVTTDGEITP